MLAKYWKKIGLIVLIIACLFNIVNKLVNSTNLGQELKASAQYLVNQQQNDKTEK